MDGRITLYMKRFKIQRHDVKLQYDVRNTRFLFVLGRYGNQSCSQGRNLGDECPSSDDAIPQFRSDGTTRLGNQGQSYGENEIYERLQRTQANNQGGEGQVAGNGVMQTKYIQIAR